MVDIEHPLNRFEKIAATNMPDRPLGHPDPALEAV
jgi:hypothetical protein